MYIIPAEFLKFKLEVEMICNFTNNFKLILTSILATSVVIGDEIMLKKNNKSYSGYYRGTSGEYGETILFENMRGKILEFHCREVKYIKDHRRQKVDFFCGYIEKILLNNQQIEIPVWKGEHIQVAGDNLERFTRQFYIGQFLMIVGQIIFYVGYDTFINDLSSSIESGDNRNYESSLLMMKAGRIVTLLGAIETLLSFRKIGNAGKELKKGPY